MGIALPEAGGCPETGRFRVPAGRVTRAGCLVLGGYLVAAVLLTWRLWAGLRTMTPLGDPGLADTDQFAWYMRYTAEAIAHGHLPALVTQALNAPRGINLMWNPSSRLPSLVMVPVTLLAGPQASLTLMLTLRIRRLCGGDVLAAAQARGECAGGRPRRRPVRFLAALLYSAVSHYNLEFAVLPA